MLQHVGKVFAGVLTAAEKQRHTQLIAQRDELMQRVDAIKVDVQHQQEPVEKDFAEQAVQRENEEVLNALDDEARLTLMQINAALHRMNTGEYGICQDCGIEIPAERLKVVPYAEYCIKCAEQHGH